ncbi:MAG: hypothetical protein IKT27_05495 [Clostridia bacterium]|nr:hypothetical protein [Clostridia bacterium]
MIRDLIPSKAKNNTNSYLEDIITDAAEKVDMAYSGLRDILDEDASDSIVGAIDRLNDGPEKEEMLKKLDRINGICDELNDANNALGAIAEEIGSNYDSPIDSWKDIVLAALPGNCSAAFAADVEEALAKFKSVY